MAPVTPPSRYVSEFDEEFDVVVVGYGFAGGAAAIAAADAGCSVLLTEKMLDPGGISITAGGGIRLAANADDAFNYLHASSDGRTDEETLRAFSKELTTLERYIRDLAAVNGANCETRHHPGNYPFPGFETFHAIEVTAVPNFDPLVGYPHVRGRNRGPLLFKVVEDNVAKRTIEVRCGAPAVRLIEGEKGEVQGVTLNIDGKHCTVKARKGVILACGGFEANADMQQQYWQMQPVLPTASRGNTGDGIKMAQELGADLWHMWVSHNSYGLKHPDPQYFNAIRMKRLPDWRPEGEKDGETVPAGHEKTVPMSWICLDQDGKRFMNENPPYAQDTGGRHMGVYDYTRMKFPRIPAYVVVDEEGRQMSPMAQTVFNDREASYYAWSDDNLKEVQSGILKQANSVAELAEIIGVEEAIIQETLDRWNHAVEIGTDEDFRRPKETMTKVATPPFLIGEIWPVVSNTQGGPRHDTKQRVVTPYDEPIPRLYEAGELGSIWGNLYLGGGNLSECFITGRIAGEEVAALGDWD
ncbi:MAG: FAD-binding protein [Proteobacteria bacterium]|nr:FAD-binding protein [Pseudomonadota bacterium]